MGYKLRSDVEMWLINVSKGFKDVSGSVIISFGNSLPDMVVKGPLVHKEAMKEIKRRTKQINSMLYKHQAQLSKLIIKQNEE